MKIQEAWFELVKNTINKHGIIPEDIHNFDEAGFWKGQSSLLWGLLQMQINKEG